MIKKKFIRALIDELNDVNENQLQYYNKNPNNVCFMVSVIDQNINKYKDFIDDITKNNFCVNGYEEDHSSGYTAGKIRILIEKSNEEKDKEEKENGFVISEYYDYHYEIEFLYDERMWGYCQCNPSDPDYNFEHKCCGHGCDWTAPAFRLSKIIDIGRSGWDGDENDYWIYEKIFQKEEKNNNEIIEQYEKEQKRKYLEEQLSEIQRQLKDLE